MAKARNLIYGFLRGGFLTDETAFKSWRVIVFVVCLLLIMISSGHRADRKIIEIAELNKKKRKLTAMYLESRIRLRKMELESNIREKAKIRGLVPAKKPPKKITIINKK